MSPGQQIKILARGDPDRLSSRQWMEMFLAKVVETAEMRPLGPPTVYDVELEIAKLGVEPFEDEGGVTGIVVLSTSHCAVHTWPLQRKLVLDLYSCRTFDTERVAEVVRMYFNAVGLQIHDLSMFLEWI